MTFTVRHGRLEDVTLIAPWTSDTFKWGDYVAQRLPRWLEDPNSHVIVCCNEADEPVAVSHAVMLSATEGWLEGARVHPDYKRQGMGNAMNDAGVAWARERGAKVVRLAIETDNVAARRQVTALGYRRTSSWVYANFLLDDNLVVDDSVKFLPAPRSDVDAAWMSWSTSELYHEGRGLIAHGWQWRNASTEDLTRVAKDGGFFQSPTGWVALKKSEADWMGTIWLTTSPEDAPLFISGLIGLARGEGASELNIKTPNVPWMEETLTRSGVSPSEVLIFSLTC